MAYDEAPFGILVICTGNRARSQMAHGWLRHLGASHVRVERAGTAPKGVHPLAVRVMSEVGIDISMHTSDAVADYREQPFDLVITVCDSAREQCPAFTRAKQVLHHAFEDPDWPMDEPTMLGVFRRLRDEMGVFCHKQLAVRQLLAVRQAPGEREVAVPRD